MSREYKTEYRLIRWKSPEELILEMNRADQDGFHEKLTRLYHADGEEGWTIFSKTYEVTPDMNEAKVALRDIWSIINRHEFKGGYDNPDPGVKAVSDDIRALYYKMYPLALSKEKE